MLGIAAFVLGPVDAGSTPASAALSASGNRAHVNVVKVSGLIDPINADLVTHAVHDANSGQALVLIVQLNSIGGVISQARSAALARLVHDSVVPVAVWVGGSGRPRAYGPAYELVRSAAYSGIGPSARVGKAVGVSSLPAGSTISGDAAVASHLVDVAAPTIGDFVVGLDGRALRPGDAPLRIAEVVNQGGVPRRQLRHDVDITFSQLTVFPRLLHSAASPNVAFVMLLIALALAVLEFFTAGVGIAAATAVLFGTMAAYGLGVLPTHPWALGLLAVAMFGFAVDVQSGAPRVWTVIGGGALVVGSLGLYRGQAVSWWVAALMVVLLTLFMVAGMPALVRTRFSTPTIGRESMIGTMGRALSGVDPDGTVEINGAPWRARTNRATPIPAGNPVRVTGIDGLVLEVEPEEGGARPARH